jgi:hypothetical protein
VKRKRKTGYRERIAGGRAAGRSPSEFDAASLAQGIAVELEHTRSRAVAREIAMDHLAERPDYYKVHRAAGLNPTDWVQVHRYLTLTEHVERARNLEELVQRMLEAQQEARTERMRAVLAQTAIVRAKRMGFRPSCEFPPLECVQELVEFVRSREETMFNPGKPVLPGELQRRMRPHYRWIEKNATTLGLARNPTTVARVDGLTFFVFDGDGGGYWAQLYDDDGPLGSKWYGETAADALELAVEQSHDRRSSVPHERSPSPGDSMARALSLKHKLLR